MIADVAADGLTVQYARAETSASRGYTQTTAYLTRAMGQVASYVLVGIGMNGKQYLGTFRESLTFSEVRVRPPPPMPTHRAAFTATASVAVFGALCRQPR